MGRLFEENVYQAVNNIQNNPLKFQIRYGSTRISFLRKFPYGIHFQINDNQILILAIFHTSQDSEKWENRK
ncbi:type II toxin-antitoxin system RelE/ParE family toxin [Cyclobacterium xiamenense]|uniref:type II toxin-antitoxin system RelE/ParE family toxin n=1 Tax=Cyclobacterium xiamenense TaxID=1297121 RepID=UPI000B80E449